MTTTVSRETAEARIYAAGFQLRSVGSVDQVETSTIPGTGILSRLYGRAVPYNTRADVGDFTEEIRPGTFTKSINEAAAALPLHMFHQHREIPVGATERWDDQADGLYGEWKLDTDAAAQRAAKAASDGYLGYMSVYFLPDAGRSELDNSGAKPHIIRKSARLVETSLVSTPVYASAGVMWVRSHDRSLRRPGAELDEWRDYLAKIKAGPLP